MEDEEPGVVDGDQVNGRIGLKHIGSSFLLALAIGAQCSFSRAQRAGAFLDRVGAVCVNGAPLATA